MGVPGRIATGAAAVGDDDGGAGRLLDQQGRGSLGQCRELDMPAAALSVASDVVRSDWRAAP